MHRAVKEGLEVGGLLKRALKNSASKLPIESEKVLEKKIAAKVKSLGGWSIKMLSTYVTGLPDRICLFPGGKVLFIEVKTTGKKPTKIQERVHERIRKLGFKILVIDNSKQIDDL